jgi:hypothetical protein
MLQATSGTRGGGDGLVWLQRQERIMSKETQEKAARDNRARQLNRQLPEYHRSRGASTEEAQRLAELAKTEVKKEVLR